MFKQLELPKNDDFREPMHGNFDRAEGIDFGDDEMISDRTHFALQRKKNEKIQYFKESNPTSNNDRNPFGFDIFKFPTIPVIKRQSMDAPTHSQRRVPIDSLSKQQQKAMPLRTIDRHSDSKTADVSLDSLIASLRGGAELDLPIP